MHNVTGAIAATALPGFLKTIYGYGKRNCFEREDEPVCADSAGGPTHEPEPPQEESFREDYRGEKLIPPEWKQGLTFLTVMRLQPMPANRT